MSAVGCVNRLASAMDQLAVAAAGARTLGASDSAITHAGVMDVLKDVGSAAESLNAARDGMAVVPSALGKHLPPEAKESLSWAFSWASRAESAMTTVQNMSTFGSMGLDSASIGAEATKFARLYMTAAATALQDARTALEQLLPPGAHAASEVAETLPGWMR